MSTKPDKKYACFSELTDEHIPIGVFDDDQDAYIAASEHGLPESGIDYYVAPCGFMKDEASYTIFAIPEDD